MPRQATANRTSPETLGGRDVVSPSDLITQHVSIDATRPVARTRRMLVLGGIPIALVGADPASVTPMCAVSARDMPVVDTLAAVAAQDPTGVLLIETRDAAFAFEVKHGRIIGARGTGPRGQLEPWVAEVHRRHPERFARGALGPDTPAWLEVARAFVEEHVLDQLALCREPGARLTLARGDIEWIGTRIPEHIGPTLRHLLLEHARRYDEEPRILAGLGALDRIAVPMREPGPKPTAAPRQAGRSEEDWDFFDDPDPAALAEWADAVRIWSLCDGQSTIAEIVDDALLGRFRSLLALHTLVKAKHVVLVDADDRDAPASGQHPLAAVIRMRPPEPEALAETAAASANPAPIADPAASSAERPIVALAPEDAIASDPDWEENSTSYSFVLRRPSPRRRPAKAAVKKGPVPPPPPAWSDRAPQRKTVVDPIDAAMRLTAPEPTDAETTRREAFVDIAAADTRREAVVTLDDPAETKRETIVDRGTAPIDVDEPCESSSRPSGPEMSGVELDVSCVDRPMIAAESTAIASASRSVGRALDRALPSANMVSITLAVTGVVAAAAAVVAMLAAM